MDRLLETCFEVSHELGAGFTEVVYQNALAIAFQHKGIDVIVKLPISVVFRGGTAGNFVADFLVENQVIKAIKAVSTLAPEHQAQIINYLKATGGEVGLCINFGTTHLQYKSV